MSYIFSRKYFLIKLDIADRTNASVTGTLGAGCADVEFAAFVDRGDLSFVCGAVEFFIDIDGHRFAVINHCAFIPGIGFENDFG